jgi:hypothetical protein
MHILVDGIKRSLDAIVAIAGHEHPAHEQPKVPKVLTAEQKAKKAERKTASKAKATQYAADLERRYQEVKSKMPQNPEQAEHYKTEHAKLVALRREQMKNINDEKGHSNEEKAAKRETVQKHFEMVEKQLHDRLGITSSMMGLPDNLWNPNTYMRAGDSLKYL